VLPFAQTLLMVIFRRQNFFRKQTSDWAQKGVEK